MTFKNYTIRPATVADAAILAHHRTEMWLAMNYLKPHAAQQMRELSVGYFENAIPKKDFIGWVVENASNIVVAGGGLSLRLTPPMPDANGETLPTSYTAHVFNIFVEPTHRKQGLARFVMQTIDNWCKENDIHTLTLNASAEGQPLYESMGYKVIKNFMRLNRK